MLKFNFSDFEFECGTDEAGRGCLAGPVTAAAIILKPEFSIKQLNDSKQLSEKIRHLIHPVIETQALSFAIVHLEPEIIDEINILNASIKAMQECIKKLQPQPQFIIVDGNRFKPVLDIPYQTIVLAKNERDAYMDRIHEEYPMYNWKKNKGYPTEEHREAIRKYGITKYHRKSFRLLPDQLSLDFGI